MSLDDTHYLAAKTLGLAPLIKLLNLQQKNAGTQTPNTPCLLYTSPSPRDRQKSRMPSSA